MSQISNLSFTKSDGTTSVTYAPVTNNAGITKWRESGAANVLAATTLLAQVLPVKKGSQIMRKRVGAVIPVMEVTSGANASGYTAGPKVAFMIGFNTDFTGHQRATAAQLLELIILAGRVIGFNGVQTGNALVYFVVNDDPLM